MSSRASLWILLVCVALLCVGHGLHGSLVAISASGADFGADVTGMIMAGYAAGMLLSSIWIPQLVRNVGHVRAFAGLASIVSTVVLLIPIWHNPWFWLYLRFVAGLCTSGLFIVCESWLNSYSNNSNRGQILSIYMIVTYGALGFGQLLLNVNDDSGFVRFIIVSALLSLSLVPLILLPTEAPSLENVKPVALLDIWKASPLAVVGSLANGMGQSAFFAMGTYFALGKGLTVGPASLMMALPPLGVIISQYPIGWLSDHFDRRRVILGLSLVSALIIGSVPFLGILHSTVLLSLVTAFGVLSMPVYSLVIAHANDHLGKDQILGASGKLVLIYGAGSILGPLVVGIFMRDIGPNAFPGYLGFVYGGLAAFALWRMVQRPHSTKAQPSDAIRVSPTTTPVGVRSLAE